MRLLRLVSLVLLLALLTACDAPGTRPAPASPLSVAHAADGNSPTLPMTPRRTPLPTRTLPFQMPSTASATPEPSPTPRPTECVETRGTVEQISIPSGTLRYPIDARLYLPPCYGATDERYPVLYLIHGLNFKEDQWERLGVATAADELSAAGEIAPLIIVMPRDRLDDRLDRAFVNDLVPYMDSTYLTLPVREFRAIGGLSRGGGWAIHIGLRYPALFGRLGAHSPAVFFGDEHDIVQRTWRLPKEQVPAVYVDVGEGDLLLHSAAWFDQVLTYSGIKHTYLSQPGAHSETYWAAHVADYLRFYAGDWRYASVARLALTPQPNDPEQAAP